MMVSEEMLAAYVDDELDDASRTAVELEMMGDPELVRRVEHHRSLRRALRAAYDPVLDEPVPDRLIDAARAAPADPARSSVIPLRPAPRAPVGRWSIPQWTAIAASLVVGALVSALVLRAFHAAPIGARGGQLVARGALASALSTELASRETPGAPVAIGITFVSKSGRYCRTFTLRGRDALAGLACRDDGAWRIEVLARSEPSAASSGAYRQAASSMPRAILDTASSEMAGEALDARAEAAARAQGWRR